MRQPAPVPLQRSEQNSVVLLGQPRAAHHHAIQTAEPCLMMPEAFAGDPLELYGTELNGGQIPEIDAFCIAHGLPFRRWSGGCLGAFLPEIILFDGASRMRDYTASEDEYVLFPPSWIRSFTRLRDLKRAIDRAEVTIPAFVVSGSVSNDRD